MARFATQPFQAPTKFNIENQYMHLTNYAINKLSKDYRIDWTDVVTHKRSLQDIWAKFYEMFEKKWVDNMILEIDDIILKTIMAA